MRTSGSRVPWLQRTKKGLLPVLIGAVALTWVPDSVQADSWWDMEVRANKYADAGKTGDAAPLWAKLVEHFAGMGTEGGWTNAALYSKRLGLYYESIQDYSNAVIYYELENQYWLKAGKDWGAEDWHKAQELRLTLELYVSTDRPETIKRAAAASNGHVAKFEPESGIYIGMYSETDPGMGNNFHLSERIYGKNHGIYLAYSPYAGGFPKRYADNVKLSGAGASLQIALEPSNGLDEVRDDAHLREWARAAKATGIPIFLRFASEMNGRWVVWHGDPAKYIEKFRIIARVMKEEAPNVAMVWTPNDVPRYSMSAYYPGDEYVDWVGVNLYTMPYGDGQPSLPGFGTSPVERLEEVYRLYADRKPIMISETAVAHRTNRDGKSHTDWAVANLERLYEVVPKKYPRVKAITYFNQNMTTRESLNDYLLRDDPLMLETYKSIIASPYYMNKVSTGAKPDTTIGYLLANSGSEVEFRQELQITPYIRLPEAFIGKVEYKLNGSLVKSVSRAPFSLDLKASEVPDGAELIVNVYGQSGKLAISKSVKLRPGVTIKVDDKVLQAEQPPINRDGSVLAPVRAIFEALGAEVAWDPVRREVTGTKGDTVVRLRIGERTVEKNGEAVSLEVPAQLVNGSTMAPVRFVGETFGGRVEWEGASRTVHMDTGSPKISAVKQLADSGFLSNLLQRLKGLAASWF